MVQFVKQTCVARDVDIIICTSTENSLIPLKKEQSWFDDHGIKLPGCDLETLQVVGNKAKMLQSLQRSGIPCPNFYTPTCIEEFEEFAEALLDQISVEIDEEKEIAKLSEKIDEDKEFPNQFIGLESFSKEIFPGNIIEIEYIDKNDIKTMRKVKVVSNAIETNKEGRKIFKAYCFLRSAQRSFFMSNVDWKSKGSLRQPKV